MESSLITHAAQDERARQAADIFGRLGESAQESLLKFARFLESEENDWENVPYSDSEMEEDIALFDKFIAEDDGYRISLEDFRAKYGV